MPHYHHPWFGLSSDRSGGHHWVGTPKQHTKHLVRYLENKMVEVEIISDTPPIKTMHITSYSGNL